jgi:hypothetical protein
MISLDASHVYRDETGRVWPGVTTILGGSKPDSCGRRAWPGVPPWLGRFDRIPADTLEYKRQLGSAVHHATALDDLGVLDEASLDEAVGVRLEGWRRYRAESGFTPLPGCIERIVWHPSIGFCGTLDRIGTLRGGTALIDVKTASASTGLDAGPQTAAYLSAARASMPERELPARVVRGSVHLTDDGRGLYVPHTNGRDWNAFLAALELWNFAQKGTR